MTRLGAAVLAVALIASACASGSRGGAAPSPVATDRRRPAQVLQVRAGGDPGRRRHDRDVDQRRQLHPLVELAGQASPIGVMKPGESVTTRSQRPGTYPYICTFHPQDMRGVVQVVAR